MTIWCKKVFFYFYRPVGTNLLKIEPYYNFEDEYSNHLNTGLVLFLNGPNVSGSQMVRFLNGLGMSK